MRAKSPGRRPSLSPTQPFFFGNLLGPVGELHHEEEHGQHHHEVEEGITVAHCSLLVISVLESPLALPFIVVIAVCSTVICTETPTSSVTLLDD